MAQYEKQKKISFIGDIMCEKPLLKGARCSDGDYDFNLLFSRVKHKFEESDYVVGNLETVCAGEAEEYTNHLYSFNSPDCFIEAIKDAGISMVTTANNHCLDRGIDGLRRTIAVLDNYGIEHTGTYATPAENRRILVKKFNGFKIAFLSYTFGTNFTINKVLLDEEEEYCVNLLKPQTGIDSKKKIGLKKYLFKLVLKVISIEQWINLKKKLNLEYNQPTVDDNLNHISEKHLKRLKSDIKKAKSEADYLIMCLHSGGQFNIEPGKFSKYIMQFLFENGVDLVVGAHPHVIQKFDLYKENILGLYSLGNFNISLSSPYIVEAHLPEYSIMLHLYLQSEGENTTKKVTFTILKALEDKLGQITVYPVLDLMQTLEAEEERMKLINDVSIIYNRFMNNNYSNVDVLDEYIILEVH